MIRLGRWKIKEFSLKVKFTIIAASITLASLLVLAHLANQSMTAQFERHHEEKASLIWTHVIDDLEGGMLSGSHASILGTINLYRGLEEVRALRVFDSKGREAFCKEKGPPVDRLEEVLRSGKTVHFQQKVQKGLLDSHIVPIRNKPECQRCHEKEEGLRGALLLTLSAETMEREIARQRQEFFILFGVIAILICAATILTVNRLFLNPLRLIQAGTRAIATGNYHHQIPMQSEDEIGSLAGNFNLMAQALQRKSEELGAQLKLVSRAESEWEKTFDCITDAIAVVGRDCTILRVNRAFREQFREFFSDFPAEIDKLKFHQLLGDCFLSSCPHDTDPQDRKPIVREVQMPKPNRVLQISIFPYESVEKELSGSVAVLRDITEQKENQFRLIMNERLAALGQMAAGLAHEINNPLATAATCAEALLQRVEKGRFEPAVFADYLRIIKEEMFRCGGVTRSMLSHLRGKNNGKDSVDIPKTLDKTVEMMAFMGRTREVEILKNYQEGLPAVPGDEGELTQVFLTIIGNALDAMEEKGKLSLETRMDGDRVFIKIADTGPGIPAEFLGRIFEPFFTTKSAKGGTGLGLSIAGKIIRKNNGRIDVTSEEGKGTTFLIALPLSSESQP